MALVNVVFNPAAAVFLKDKTQVRIRIKDNRLQFRPTDRASEINLPKGERLRPIFRSNRSAYFVVKEDFLEVNNFATIEEHLYGWYSLVQTDVEQKGVPLARFNAVATVGKRPTRPFKTLNDCDKQASSL